MRSSSVTLKLSSNLQGNNDPLVTVANIIKGIQQKLQEFRMVQVCYVRRQTNKPAHVLAQDVKGVDNFITWIEENPSMIETSLTQDVSNFSSS